MKRYGDELNWVDARQGDMVALLTELASINTGSYNTAGLSECLNTIRRWLQANDLPSHETPLESHRIVMETGDIEARPLGKAITIASEIVTGPRVLLAIHYDTVFGPRHTFQNVTPDVDILRGPGVCDAKGGIAVLLFGLLAFLKSPLARKLNWKVILNPDEEIGSPGSAELLRAAAEKCDVALLFEPALPDGSLVSARKGSGNYTIVVRGKAAHAGRDAALGRNAIHALAGVITRVAALQHEIPGITVNTGFVHGGGPVNIVPDQAMTRINFRVDSGDQQQAVEENLAVIVSTANSDGITAELHGGFHCPPKILDRKTEMLLNAFADCGKHLDLNLAWRPTGGACDGNRIAAAGIPTVDSLGPRGGGMHTDQEFIYIDSLAERAKLLTLFLCRLAAGEINLKE